MYSAVAQLAERLTVGECGTPFPFKPDISKNNQVVEGSIPSGGANHLDIILRWNKNLYK